VAAQDPLRLIDDFDTAWNSHDEEGMLNLFAEDAVARLVPAPPGEPDAYEGRAEIRDFVRRHMPGFRVESRDHQVAGHHEEVGDRVIWESTVSSERFRDLGAEEVEGTAEAIVKGGKIESFTFSLSHKTLDSIRAAGGRA
jgi:ketosteroid isomerase-like protein